MIEKADATPLLGREFVASSGNSCRFQMMEQTNAPGALWKNKPSDEDISEIEIFVTEVLALDGELSFRHQLLGKMKPKMAM